MAEHNSQNNIETSKKSGNIFVISLERQSFQSDNHSIRRNTRSGRTNSILDSLWLLDTDKVQKIDYEFFMRV